MSRDDFEELDKNEKANRRRYTPGTFSPELFARMLPSARLTPRTQAVLDESDPAAVNRVWSSVWIAHNRHPTLAARALALLLAHNPTSVIARETIEALERMNSYKKSSAQSWWPLVRR